MSSCIQTCTNSSAYKGTSICTFVVGALAAIITVVCLLIIFENYLRSSISTKLMDNVSLLKPAVVEKLWATAKWSGIIGGGCLVGLVCLVSLQTKLKK